MVSLLVLAAPAAAAEVACVDVERPECTQSPATLTAALAGGAEVVHVGPGPYAGPFASANPVELVGSEGTVIGGDLALTGGAVALRNARVEGRLDLGPGPARLADLDLADVRLDGTDLEARHLTVMGRVSADGGSATFGSSAFAGPDPFRIDGAATIATEFSAHAADADAAATDRIEPPRDPRAVAGSVLVDAGDPAPLAPFEPFEDAAAAPRVADGNGDGVLRRDVGAYEAQAAPVPIPLSSVLVNGGAEDGLAGWSGTFAAEPFGTAFLPSRHSGVVLGAGGRFFSGAASPQADLFQRIDVTGAAASIDRGLGRAALSGLLGGYGADADALTVRAVFKDPENVALGVLELPAVTAADRANATTLLRRAAAAAIPPRTRAIDVLLRAERQAGAYTDGYADNLALVLSVPGVPVEPPGDPGDPPVDDLRPFDGVTVLTARARATPGGRVPFLLACADATVGACRGTVVLRARLAPGGRLRRVGRVTGFAVRPGLSRPTAVRLVPGVRRQLARRPSLTAILVATAYDGQGLERRTTVPVTLAVPALRG